MPLVNLQQVELNKAHLIYDSVGAISGVDANTSVEYAAPDMMFIEGLAAGTTISVQVRPTATASWYEMQLVDGATTADAIVYMNKKFNFTRTVRVGASPVKVFVQDAYHG